MLSLYTRKVQRNQMPARVFDYLYDNPRNKQKLLDGLFSWWRESKEQGEDTLILSQIVHLHGAINNQASHELQHNIFETQKLNIIACVLDLSGTKKTYRRLIELLR